MTLVRPRSRRLGRTGGAKTGERGNGKASRRKVRGRLVSTGVSESRFKRVAKLDDDRDATGGCGLRRVCMGEDRLGWALSPRRRVDGLAKDGALE